MILDWARCARGPAALDLAELLFEMGRLEDLEGVLAAYLSAFEEGFGQALDADALRQQLGGALLRKVATSTCGVARWQPASPREAAMIEATIGRAIWAVEYWAGRDPALFSFLR